MDLFSFGRLVRLAGNDAPRLGATGPPGSPDVRRRPGHRQVRGPPDRSDRRTGNFSKKSRTGANIRGGPRVYSGIRDAATALTRRPAGINEDNTMSELIMFADGISLLRKRLEASRLAGRPASTRGSDPRRL